MQIPSPQLQASAKQQLHLAQRLIMSAHMQQAIRLLQLPLQELEPFIEEQIVANPLLEIASDEEENEAQDEAEGEREEEESEVSISDKDLAILHHLEEDLRDHFAQSEPVPIKRSSE